MAYIFNQDLGTGALREPRSPRTVPGPGHLLLYGGAAILIYGPMGPKCLLGPFKALWAHGAKCPQGPSRPYGPYGPMGPKCPLRAFWG